MNKKITAYITALAMLFTSLPYITASADYLLFSETFSSYADNATNFKSINAVSGTDTRVLNDNGNKVLFSRAFGVPVLLRLTPESAVDDKTVFSAKIKITGKASNGKLFSLTSGSKTLTLFTITDRTIKMPDGKILGGIPKDSYKTYTAVIDWVEQKYDVYVDQKCMVKDWLLPLGGYKPPEKVEFGLSYDDEESDLYIDDLRIYNGNTLPWNKDFPAEKVSNEVIDFTPTESIDNSFKLLNDHKFTSSLDGISVISYPDKGVVSTNKEEETGITYMRMYSDDKSTGGTYVDIHTDELPKYPKYVIDLKMKVKELKGEAYAQFLVGRVDANTWRSGYTISSDGTFSSASYGKIANVSLDEWIRLSFAFNIPQGNVDIYIDGTKIKSHPIRDDMYPSLHRIDIVNNVGGVHDVLYDWIKIYTGNEIQDEKLFSEDPDDIDTSSLHTIMDPKDKLTEALDGKIVFMMTNDKMYVNGEKQSYKDESYEPLLMGDTLMIPLNLLRLIYKGEIKWDEQTGKISLGQNIEMKCGEREYTLSGNHAMLSAPPMVQNDILYFPLRSVAEQILKKCITWDERGAVTLSDEPMETDDYYYQLSNMDWKSYDLIYRYMQFDNPTGTEIINSVKTNFPNNQHPRILYTSDDVDYMLDKIDSDSEWKKAYNSTIEAANAILLVDFSDKEKAADGDPKQLAARDDFQKNEIILAEAYFLTGDQKYAAKGVEIMKNFCRWETMGNDLGAGHWAAGMGIGFDTFYNYMNSSKEGREDIQFIKESIKRLPYASYIPKYDGSKDAGCVDDRGNFLGPVCGGLMILGLAVCDEEDMQAQTGYLMENVIKSLGIAVSLFSPDGGYFESVSYGGYMLGNLTIAINALFNSCKTDYGLGSPRGFTDAGDSFTYLQSPDDAFNFHDCEEWYCLNDIREFFAYRYNKPETAELAKIQKFLGGHDRDLHSLYYYDRAVKDKGLMPDVSAMPNDKYFHGIQTGTFASSRLVSNPVFAGFHGGLTSIQHDMLDLGSFIFESDNYRWAIDLGRDGYSLPDYFSMGGYRIYRKRPEGENCIVLNPQVESDFYYGQQVGALAECYKLDLNKPKGAFAAMDLTEAYERDVTKYTRGYYFGDNRTSLTVQDELSLKGDTELYWFMHTKADIEIIDNTKAKFTADDGSGKTLTVDIHCNIPDYTVKVMESEPLPSSPVVAGQGSNAGTRKLAIYAPNATGDVQISVKLSPDSYSDSYTALEYVPIDEWQIPEGYIPKTPTLSALYADGMLIEKFVTGKYSYTMNLPYGTEKVPQIMATSNDATVSIKQASTLAETTEITLTREGCKPVIYTVKYEVSKIKPIYIKDSLANVKPYAGKKDNLIKPVSAVSYTLPQPENGPDKSIDDSFETRCAQDGTGMWIEYDLGEVMDIKGIAISFYSGDTRISKYDIMYSVDGFNYTRVFTGSSCGETPEYEILDIPASARYIRYVGNGNSTSTWNSVTEFRAFK